MQVQTISQCLLYCPLCLIHRRYSTLTDCGCEGWIFSSAWNQLRC